MLVTGPRATAAARTRQGRSAAHRTADRAQASAPPAKSQTPAQRHQRATGKLAGLDKKLSKSLDEEVQAGSSPQELSMSPVGPLSDSARCVRAPPPRARKGGEAWGDLEASSIYAAVH